MSAPKKVASEWPNVPMREGDPRRYVWNSSDNADGLRPERLFTHAEVEAILRRAEVVALKLAVENSVNDLAAGREFQSLFRERMGLVTNAESASGGDR